MNKPAKITFIFVLTAVSIITIYDVFIIWKYGIDASISVQIWHYSRIPAVPFAFGFLAGHLFGQNRIPD